MIEPKCVATEASQLNFMHDFFQNQLLLLAPMKPLNGNFVAYFLHNFEKGSSFQSQKLNFDSKLMQLKAENRGD